MFITHVYYNVAIAHIQLDHNTGVLHVTTPEAILNRGNEDHPLLIDGLCVRIVILQSEMAP